MGVHDALPIFQARLVRALKRFVQLSFVEVTMAFSLTENRRSQDWINLVLAVCLFISPWVVGFAGEAAAAWNAWVVAVVLGAIAVAALTAFAEWEEWINLLLGIWLVISPWALGFAAMAGAMWTAIVLGALVAVVSAWAVWDYRQHPHAHA